MLTFTETGGRRSQNILKNERIYRQSRGDPAGLAGRGGPRPFTETGGEVPINVRKKLGLLLPRGRRAYFPRHLRRQVGLPCRSLGGRIAPLFDFGEECVETLASGVSSFGQPDLEQTQKTKSVVYTQRRVTPRTLVRQMRDR